MPETIIAKIQNRHGLRANLPQPLSPGELGICLDTGQVYVGLDPNDPNSIVSPIIATFTPSTQTTNDANAIINDQLVLINLTASTDVATIASDFNVDEEYVRINDDNTKAYVAYDSHAAATATSTGGAITSVNIANYGYGYTGSITGVSIPGGDNNAVVDFTVVGGSITTATIVTNGTGYTDGVVYHPDIPIPTGTIVLPSPSYGTAGFFSPLSTLDFDEGRMDLSDLGYIPSDLDAIATLINSAYRLYDSASGSIKPGLVKLVQNVEILTEFSRYPTTPDVLFSDYNLPIRGLLVTNTGAGFTDVPNGTFGLTNSNSFVIEYSLSDGGSYNRVGTILVSVNDSAATINDTYTELNPSTYAITFQAIRTGGNEVILQYNKPFSTNIQMSMMVRRWYSSW
jgi:hypothetical protein